jgi:hypothetical protein
MAYPVAPKTAAAGTSAAVAGAVLYVLQVYVFKGNVPAGIESLIYASVPGLVAFVAAYLAPHQVRPGDTPPAPVPAPAVLSSSSLTAAQMETIREALIAAEPQTAADERKVPPAP